MSAAAVPWSGPMRQRIRIERNVAAGEEAPSWDLLQTVRASFRERQPREPFEAGRDVPMALGTFRIRYRASLAVTEDMRVVFRSQVWSIERVENPFGGNSALLLHCRLRREDQP